MLADYVLEATQSGFKTSLAGVKAGSHQGRLDLIKVIWIRLTTRSDLTSRRPFHSRTTIRKKDLSTTRAGQFLAVRSLRSAGMKMVCVSRKS